MAETAVLRVFHFRTLRPAFDSTLREVVLPAVRELSGAVAVWAGRQGPGELGARLLASVWASREAMRSALGEDPDEARILPETMVETSERRLEVAPVILLQIPDQPLATGILRLAHGELREGDVGRYGRQMLGDLERLHERQAGPSAFVLAGASERGFVMVSTWPHWEAIEAATGASVSDPLRTKRLAGLSAFEADHYELLGDLAAARPGSAAL